MTDTLLDLLGLPDPEDFIFENPPLVLTICQVRFPPVLSIVEAAFVAPFQRAIYGDYPMTIQGTDIELQFGFGTGTLTLQQGRQSALWQFSDHDDNWKVVLAQDFLSLETRGYSHFEDFLDRLQKVLTVLVQHIHPSVVTRIGLRYINEIRLDGLAWSNAIHSHILGPLSLPQFEAHSEHMVEELLLSYPNNERIRIRHGRFPGGTTVRPRVGEEFGFQPFYLLDFDAFRDSPLPGGLPMQPEVISDLAVTFNEAIYRLFRWSITDDYASRMGGAPK